MSRQFLVQRWRYAALKSRLQARTIATELHVHDCAALYPLSNAWTVFVYTFASSIASLFVSHEFFSWLSSIFIIYGFVILLHSSYRNWRRYSFYGVRFFDDGNHGSIWELGIIGVPYGVKWDRLCLGSTLEKRLIASLDIYEYSLSFVCGFTFTFN